MISSKILELRKNKNISQEELAKVLNASRQAISKWERGESYPDIDKLRDLAIYFGVSIDYLLDYDIESTSVNSFIDRLEKAIDINQYDISEEEITSIVSKNSNNFNLLLHIVCYLFEAKSLNLSIEYSKKCINIYQANEIGVTINDLRKVIVFAYILKEEYGLAKKYIEDNHIVDCDIELAECEINLGNLDKTNEIISNDFLKSVINLTDDVYVQIRLLLKTNKVIEAYDLIKWSLSFVDSLKKDENLFFEGVYFLNLFKIVCEHHLNLDYLPTLNYLKENYNQLFVKKYDTKSLKYYEGEKVSFLTLLTDVKTTLEQGLKLYRDNDIFVDIEFVYKEMFGGMNNE